MYRESANCELKSQFISSAGSRIELVKDLVAIANTGGGSVFVGRTETGDPGVDCSLLDDLDGAKISDLMASYVSPGRPSVSHAALQADSPGNIVIQLTVGEAGKYPFVFSKEGLPPDKKRPVFRQGDIYVRHGAKSEPIGYADVVRIIDSAVSGFQDEVAERVRHAVRVPPGTTVVYETPAGTIPDSPAALIDLVAARRQRNNGAIIEGGELLWCFIERSTFELTPDRVDVLIRSALRRTPTLFFWLAELDDLNQVASILLSTLDDTDRDKSDAGKAILEAAAVAADDETIVQIVGGLSTSRYAHFREAAEGWASRQEATTAFRQRVQATRIDGKPATEYEVPDLLREAENIANQIFRSEGQSSLSRRLGELGRVVFAVRHGVTASLNE